MSLAPAQWKPTSFFEQSTEIEPEVSFPLRMADNSRKRSLKRCRSLVYLQVFGKLVRARDFVWKLLLQKLRFQFVSFVHTPDENKSLQSERLKGVVGVVWRDAKLLKSRFVSFCENRFRNSSQGLGADNPVKGI